MENKIILLAAISKDGFIADSYGNGNFSSAEDKQQFRLFLRSENCDCFVCGRKTAEEFKDRLRYKPLFVLSSQPKKNEDNYIFIKNLSELFHEMNERNLSKCALLGGAKTYHYFLDNNVVEEMRITEENLIFNNGVKFDIEKYLVRFRKIGVQHLSLTTQLLIFRKNQKIR